MNHQPSAGFLLRRRSKQIKAQIMPHDARKQLAFCVVTVFGMLLRRIVAYVDGGPRRRPERIDACFLVKEFSNVPPLHRHSNSDMFVLDLYSGKVAIKGHLTLRFSSREESFFLLLES